MSVYLITPIRGADKTLNTVMEQWPDRFQRVTDDFILLAPTGVSTVSSVAEKIGLSGEAADQTGMVVKLDRSIIAGILPTVAVEWLMEAFKSDA